jgi:hypothetical protein
MNQGRENFKALRIINVNKSSIIRSDDFGNIYFIGLMMVETGLHWVKKYTGEEVRIIIIDSILRKVRIRVVILTMPLKNPENYWKN